MTYDPQPLAPEEGGLHGDIPDTPEARAWFKQLGERALKSANADVQETK